jgi:hypothetical protein
MTLPIDIRPIHGATPTITEVGQEMRVRQIRPVSVPHSAPRFYSQKEIAVSEARLISMVSEMCPLDHDAA